MPSKSKNENQNNRLIILNSIWSFIIKGGSIAVSFFTIPAYNRYFPNDSTLGVWLVILSISTLILYFDLGIGNGLRNKLPELLLKKDYKSVREYISSAYIFVILFVLVVIAIFYGLERFIDWNALINTSTSNIAVDTLSTSMKITVISVLFYFISGLVVPLFYALQKAAINGVLSLISSVSFFLYVQFAPRHSEDENLIALSVVHAIIINLPHLVATIILFASKLRMVIPSIFHFSIKKAGEIIKIGLVLLFLQIVFAVVSRTHELLISRIISPEAVVEYNNYNKVFGTITSILIMVLIPIWSAVTKAQVEKNYNWIRKVYKLLFLFVFISFFINLAILPFLQFGMDMWLKENTITVNMKYALIMCFFNTIFILHSVNTTICNGLSRFFVQFVWMLVAAILAVPASLLFCQITGNWTGVIIGCGISMLPYELIQPFSTSRYLTAKSKEIRITRLLENLEVNENTK